MPDDSFSDAAVHALKNYVYRLVDPRNEESFYVGRGTGQRVFEHIRGAVISNDGDEVDLKSRRINQIHAQGLKVQQVIHRCGMELNIVRKFEAALIYAYPGLANRMGGSRAPTIGVCGTFGRLFESTMLLKLNWTGR